MSLKRKKRIERKVVVDARFPTRKRIALQCFMTTHFDLKFFASFLFFVKGLHLFLRSGLFACKYDLRAIALIPLFPVGLIDCLPSCIFFATG